jgi:hypothetical protein
MSLATTALLLSVSIARAEDTAVRKQGVYPPIQDQPSTTNKHGMTPDEQAQLKKTLIDARERQSKAKESPARAKPKKP